jgi:ABC-type sugar transport system permease subunit
MLDPLRLPRALASAPNIDWAAYLYLLPAGFLLTLFGLWPIVFGFWISLWRWGITPERFVGIQNYLRILGNELVTTDAAGRPAAGEIGQSLVITLYYAVGTVPLSVALAFVVAFLLFEGTPLRKRDAAPITEMFGSVNTMFKSTPDQQLASWIFMAEMASTDTQSRLGADAGYFPSTRSAIASPRTW